MPFLAFNKRQKQKISVMHTCSICGIAGSWKSTWMCFGSQIDEDEGTLLKMCSKRCRGIAAVCNLMSLLPKWKLRGYRATRKDAEVSRFEKALVKATEMARACS